jgi:nitroreductase
MIATDFHPIPLEYERLPLETSLRRSRRFLEQMKRRRTVRHFSEEMPPLELIENAIAAAGAAPSGANQQPWTFVVVSSPALKRRLRAAAEVEERKLYFERASQEMLDTLRPIGTDWNKPHVTDAPYLIAVFEQPYGVEDGEKRKHYYVRESVGIAVGFLLVSLHDAGLVALTHSPSPMGFLNEILERPRNERPFILVATGYPADGALVPDLCRKELDEFAIFR